MGVRGPQEQYSSVISESIQHIFKFGGHIWHVDGVSGNDDNTGLYPDDAFLTIGKAITVYAAGDAVSIRAGTYTETGLDIALDGIELWFEIGAILDPASLTALTISGSNCKVDGILKITPDSAAVGMIVSGNECNLNNIKIVDGADCFQITGTGTILNNCLGGFPAAGKSSFNVTGAQTGLYDCGSVGDTTSCGYKVTGSNTGILSHCTSVGNQTSGYYLDTGTLNWTVLNCSSGGGDGQRRDIDDTNVWSNFTYPETKYKEITLDGSTDYNLFEITGAIEITEIYGHVTTELVGVNTDVYWQLYSTTSDDNITKITDADMGAAVVGSIIMKTEDPGKKATFFDGAGVSVDKGTDPKKKAVTINAHNDETTYIRWVVTAGDTGGVIHFHVVWRPLTDDGFLEPV